MGDFVVGTEVVGAALVGCWLRSLSGGRFCGGN